MTTPDPAPPAPDYRLRPMLERGEWLLSAELDPPHGLDADAGLRAAVALRDAGADCVDVGDSPMASVRMSPIAFAARGAAGDRARGRPALRLARPQPDGAAVRPHGRAHAGPALGHRAVGGSAVAGAVRGGVGRLGREGGGPDRTDRDAQRGARLGGQRDRRADGVHDRRGGQPQQPRPGGRDGPAAAESRGGLRRLLHPAHVRPGRRGALRRAGGGPGTPGRAGGDGARQRPQRPLHGEERARHRRVAGESSIGWRRPATGRRRRRSTWRRSSSSRCGRCARAST